MEVTIVEPSLHEIVDKAIGLSGQGYKLVSVMQIGWIYELRMDKEDRLSQHNELPQASTQQLSASDRMAKARAARGVSK